MQPPDRAREPWATGYGMIRGSVVRPAPACPMTPPLRSHARPYSFNATDRYHHQRCRTLSSSHFLLNDLIVNEVCTTG